MKSQAVHAIQKGTKRNIGFSFVENGFFLRTQRCFEIMRIYFSILAADRDILFHRNNITRGTARYVNHNIMGIDISTINKFKNANEDRDNYL